MTRHLLEVERVTRRFASRRWLGLSPGRSVTAVDGVSFAVEHGETFGLVGESGCGKSTTGRLVLELEPADSGEIRFAGRPLGGDGAEWRRRRREMQLVFQDPLGALDPRMPILDQVREPLDIHAEGSPADRDEAARRTIDAVGLRDAGDRFPHELSGGQRQRVVIARALVLRPRLVVCDEPVSALDVSIQAQVVNLLQDLQQQLGLTYLFISHDLRIVRHVSRRIAVMYLGEIVETAPKDTLFASPLHPYTRALIDAVPVADPARRRGRRALAGEPPSALSPPTGCRFASRCPHVRPRCGEERPVLRRLATGHDVACHFAEETAA